MQAENLDACFTGSKNATTSPEMTQGPYHIDEVIFRQNLTDGQVGIALQLKLTVLDTYCQPIADAFVETWQANATGYYSGIEGICPIKISCCEMKCHI